MLYIHPYLGKMNPLWRSYFSNGLVQPPTSLWVFFTVKFSASVISRAKVDVAMAQSMADAGEFPFWGLKLVVFLRKYPEKNGKMVWGKEQNYI